MSVQREAPEPQTSLPHAAGMAPELICYPTETDPPKLVPARPEREWMDLTDQRYAYRCIPLSIAMRKPGEWQTYDVVWTAPTFNADGTVKTPAYVTAFHNGVLVQDHTRLEGGTGHMTRSRPEPFSAAGPLKLQDHGNPVRYRNIWYRPLPPRPVEGGTDGYLTTEAATAKRKELAASIRQDAEKLTKPTDQMLRLAESLEYDKDEPTFQKVSQMAEQYVANVKQLPADQLTSKKDEVRHVRDAFRFLAKFKVLPPDYEPRTQLEEIIKAQRWDEKKKS